MNSLRRFALIEQFRDLRERISKLSREATVAKEFLEDEEQSSLANGVILFLKEASRELERLEEDLEQKVNPLTERGGQL